MSSAFRGFVSLVVLLSCAVSAMAERPEQWAVPLPGGESLPNLFKVDEGLYRGAQPRDGGFERLRSMGLRTVVSFRTTSSDREVSARNGLAYVRLPTQPWDVNDEEVVEFLKIAASSEHRPVFAHCYHGSDRTGVMVAAYRVVVQDWSKNDAIEEMVDGGYGFHSSFRNLVKYIEEMDAEAIAAAAGLAKKPRP
ncbi:MAG: tyrosine-protein phosphatase [Acidobacteriota bacterium]|nr:tyrosine-protein phosphatase [Acidobacteriota bacterium]